MPDFVDLIDRATKDPDFLSRLAADPMSIVQSEEYSISPEQLGAVFGNPNASQQEIAETLKARLSHFWGK
jgi:hypothetical protein